MMYPFLVNKHDINAKAWGACWQTLEKKVKNLQTIKGFFWDYYPITDTGYETFFNDLEGAYQETAVNLQEDYVDAISGFTLISAEGYYVEVFLNDPTPKPKKINYEGGVSRNAFLKEYPHLPEELKASLWNILPETRHSIDDFVSLWNMGLSDLGESEQFTVCFPVKRRGFESSITISFPIKYLL